jgi:hypothetical protein
METQRHIGIDLHRNQFTCCVRLENGRNYLSQWKLEDLERFTKKLRPSPWAAPVCPAWAESCWMKGANRSR